MSYDSTIHGRGSLVAHYRLGESSGAVVDDVGGLNGTGSGSPTYSATGLITGDADTAITFDGSDDKFSLASAGSFDFQLNQPFTVEALVRPNMDRSGSNEFRAILSKLDGGNNNRGFEVGLVHRGGEGRTVPYFYLVDNESTPINILLWSWTTALDLELSNATNHHIMWVYDGTGVQSGMHIFVDGVEYPYEIGQNNGTLTSIDSAVAPAIGSRPAGVLWFKGTLDELAVYSAALRPYEANESFAAMKGTAIETTALAANPRILVSLDADSDVGDCGAMSVVHAVTDLGHCTLLGTVTGSSDPDVAELLDAINTFHLRPTLPVGKASAADPVATGGWVAATIAQCIYDLDGTTAAESWEKMRELLAGVPDNSAVIIEIGYPTALSALLDSPGDGFSALNGVDLVAAKCRYVVFMGGLYTLPTANTNAAEYNFRINGAATDNVLDLCPVPIHFIGYESGVGLVTGGRLNAEGDTDDPTRISYDEAGLLVTGREAWDQLAMLYAVYGKSLSGSPLFTAIPGTNSANPANGQNTWTYGSGDHFLVRPARSNAEMKVIIEALEIATPTGGGGGGTNRRSNLLLMGCGA